MATTTNKRKKAVAATVAAAAILLAGTFAWTSISQTALNEAIVDINPGNAIVSRYAKLIRECVRYADGRAGLR